jgi:sulfatase modifying factor 1
MNVMEHLMVLEDARLSGVRPPAELLRQLSDALGASEVGLDSHGLWLRVDLGGAAHRMRWAWPGSYLRGSPPDEVGRYPREGPQHQITLTCGFFLGETPVTQELWSVLMGDNPSRFRRPERPVENVSWFEAHLMLDALIREAPRLQWRLPTEAEWEYAARAGTSTATYAGDLREGETSSAPFLDDIAWYLFSADDSEKWKTRSVAQKTPNRWGLYDMLGNVQEWCRDHNQWDSEGSELLPYRVDHQWDPVSLDGDARIVRGGDWGSEARGVRAAARMAFHPDSKNGAIGFRLVAVPNG